MLPLISRPTRALDQFLVQNSTTCGGSHEQLAVASSRKPQQQTYNPYCIWSLVAITYLHLIFETQTLMSTAKGLKQKLEQISAQDRNVYQHLSQVLRQMLIDNPRNAYDLFEQYSLQIRHAHEKSAKGAQPHSKFTHENYEQLKAYIQKTKALINKPNVGTEQEPQEPGPTGYVPNLMEEAKWFENVGVGFGEELTYKIFKSLERFSIVKQIKQLKFWGKIVCQTKDYYVAEGLADGGEEAGELPPDVEPKGTGVNKMNYWVSTDLNGDWVELPIVTPQQMRVSRKIKYFFTGDLEAPVVRNPFFPGKEKHLLKCQILRITASCTVVPRTMYNINADDKKQIDPAEEWKFPSFEFLSTLDNWVHHPQTILKNGRMGHLKPEIPEGAADVDEEKLMKEIEAKDPFEERLKPISQDKYVNVPSWKLSIVGDTCNYRALGKAPQKINYGFISLKSIIWKGFTTIYHNKQWTSIYVGYGFKTSKSNYYPCEPENILSECKDKDEQPEPNFPPQEPKKDEPPQEAPPAEGQ